MNLNDLEEMVTIASMSSRLSDPVENLQTEERNLSVEVKKDLLEKDKLDAMTQTAIYLEDSDFNLFLQSQPIEKKRAKDVKEALAAIIKTFNENRLVCDKIYVPSILLTDIIDPEIGLVEPVTQKVLHDVGYVGLLRKESVMIHSASVLSMFREPTGLDEVIGLNSLRLLKERSESYKLEGNILSCKVKYELQNPKAIVRVKIQN